MSDSPFSKCGLFLMSAVVLVIALGTWTMRGQRAGETSPAITSQANQIQDESLRQRQRAQHAVALLFRAFHADNHLTYSAVSDTMAFYGGREMKALARVTRTPQSLSIEYVTGAQKGLRSGFNGRWYWRQRSPGAPLEAYAEMQRNSVDIAARRFALMLENYDVQLKGRGDIEGHPVEIVELTSFSPSPGAHGPRKSLAIDTQTGLTLRVETFDHQKQRIMLTTLSKIDYTPDVTPVPSDKIIAVSQEKPWMIQDLGKDVATVVKLTGLQPPKLNYLPPGFRFDTVGVHRCRYGNAPFQAALARYTDGMNTLTVFVMKPSTAGSLANLPPDAAVDDAVPPESPVQPVAAQANAPIPVPAGKGQACDFGPGTLIMRATPRGRLIAVGDLPSSELERVLDRASIPPVR
ncbi:MAG TPA: sigma-E factor regulatory protein RseB domain-containing protein [Abditibacteriaceae bacterium]|nr:sigma-E factor regulatory protein RseB domain-containing protein [Abditibacteriaceae bacterium]